LVILETKSMKNYKTLLEERAEIRRKIGKLSEVRKTFEEYLDQPSSMALARWLEDRDAFWRVFYQTVDDLKHKEEALNKEMDELEKNCTNHDWVYEGRDSHYSYEVCTICGKSEKM
jgi:wobble nucleotide-excising tRNase